MIILPNLSLLLSAGLPQPSKQGHKGQKEKCFLREMPFTVCSRFFGKDIIFCNDTSITGCLVLPQIAIVQ